MIIVIYDKLHSDEGKNIRWRHFDVEFWRLAILTNTTRHCYKRTVSLTFTISIQDNFLRLCRRFTNTNSRSAKSLKFQDCLLSNVNNSKTSTVVVGR